MFRSKRYAAFFTVLGFSIAVILLVMVYRSGIERTFRRIRVAQRLRHRAERSRDKD
jgi:hypothetical protein